MQAGLGFLSSKRSPGQSRSGVGFGAAPVLVTGHRLCSGCQLRAGLVPGRNEPCVSCTAHCPGLWRLYGPWQGSDVGFKHGTTWGTLRALWPRSARKSCQSSVRAQRNWGWTDRIPQHQEKLEFPIGTTHTHIILQFKHLVRLLKQISDIPEVQDLLFLHHSHHS